MEVVHVAGRTKRRCLEFLVLLWLWGSAQSLVPSRSNGNGNGRRASSWANKEITASTSVKKLQHLRGGGMLHLSPAAAALAETLAPKVGILTSTALYFAPALAVLRAIDKDDMGDLNPLPLAVMSIVSVSWLAYGIAARDNYVALSNIGGCIASIGYVLGVLPLLAKEKRQQRQLRITQGVSLVGASSVLCLWTYLGMTRAPTDHISSVLGLFASALFIVLSASPLSTIRSVLSTRDASSILGSFTAAQVANTSLWSAYGLAIRDRFVWGPNVVGLGLGIIQLILKLCFPNKQEP